MRDADDVKIMRQVVWTVAAAIFCLLCGGISGIFIVRDTLGGGSDEQRVVQLQPTPAPGR